MAWGTRRPGRGVRGVAATVLSAFGLTLAVSIALAWGPGVASAGAACPHADAHPRDVPLPKIRKAITCLINQKRTKQHRRALEPNAKLQSAAQGHNDVMLANDCFRHECPGEPGLTKRVRRTGYLKNQRAWRFAENLGFDQTPLDMIRAWLHDPFNRRNIFNDTFRDVGVGVGWGAPKPGLDDRDFATYTVVFAFRKPRR